MTSGEVRVRNTKGWVGEFRQGTSGRPRGPYYSFFRGRRTRYSPKVSKAEERLASFMSKNGIPFETQVLIPTKGRKYLADFVVRGRCVVECEGRVHAAMVEHDNERESMIREQGYDVLRFPNFQVFGDISSVLQKIKDHSCFLVQPSGARGN